MNAILSEIHIPWHIFTQSLFFLNFFMVASIFVFSNWIGYGELLLAMKIMEEARQAEVEANGQRIKQHLVLYKRMQRDIFL
jgi:hypothetical protein